MNSQGQSRVKSLSSEKTDKVVENEKGLTLKGVTSPSKSKNIISLTKLKDYMPRDQLIDGESFADGPNTNRVESSNCFGGSNSNECRCFHGLRPIDHRN